VHEAAIATVPEQCESGKMYVSEGEADCHHKMTSVNNRILNQVPQFCYLHYISQASSVNTSIKDELLK